MNDMSEKNFILLPPIPAKRYFTIGEVSELCGVKPHVLRYWEQEFTQLKPVKRRGNRRYYQRHEVLLIRKIRKLLYEDGFTIHGARSRLDIGQAIIDIDHIDQISQRKNLEEDGKPDLFNGIVDTQTEKSIKPFVIAENNANLRTQLLHLLKLFEG